MNRINIIILIYLVFGGILFAQNEVQDMNIIKCNSNYIYATGTSLTSNEEASQNAKDLLKAEIEDWLKKYAESLKFELGVAQTYYQGGRQRNQIQFSTGFKL